MAYVVLLAPTLIPLAGWAGLRQWGRPDWGAVVLPIGVFAAVLAFQGYSHASGSTFPFLRFYIVAIPFATFLAMLAVPVDALAPATRRGRFAPPASPASAIRPGRKRYAVVALVLAVSIPSAAWAMSLPRYAPQEYALGAVLAPDPDSVGEREAVERRIAATFSTERQIAKYLDGLDLPEGSVITDTVYGFAIVAASDKPKTFVVPSDPDFIRLLSDP